MMSYLNTRIAVMRGELMPRPALEDLLTAENERTFFDRLLSSPYGSALSEQLSGKSPREALNRGLFDHMSACFTRILRIAPSEVRDDLNVIFEWLDVQALKAILRGLHSGLPPATIRNAAGVGNRLTGSQLEILSEEPDIPSAIAQLATWKHPYAGTMSRRLGEYHTSGDPIAFEEALDQLRYDLPQSHPAASLMAIEAEIRNVVNALNAFSADRKPPVLNQGKRSTRLINDLRNAGHPNEAIAILADSRFNTVLDKALSTLLMNQERFSLLERLMDEALIREISRAALIDPDSLAVPYQYMVLKWNEVKNVRLIGIGLMDGLQSNLIRSALVFKEAA